MPEQTPTISRLEPSNRGSSDCEFFSGIPMFDEIELVHWSRPGGRIGLLVPGWDSWYSKNRRPNLERFREIVSADYHRDSYDLDWSIWIYAVPREQKNALKSVLLQHGFPLMKAWLSTQRHDTWYEGRRVIQVGVDDKITELCFFETHNDRAIKEKVVAIQI